MKSQSEVGAANKLLREGIKRGLRGYGQGTGRLRPGPDFVVIGAKRGGTTSLYNYLLEHPSIHPTFPRRQQIKGVHYYDSNYARGDQWYRSHFPLQIGGRHIARPADPLAMSGEASPYYLFHPLAAERLAADHPDVRIIVFLRDPIERAYSHYKERIENHGEPLSFEEALDAEPERLRGEAERIVTQPGYLSAEHENHSYVAQGRYLDMLPRWFGLFAPEQFHLAFSEDFYADPGRAVNGVWSFLGLPPAPLRSRKRYNYQPAPEIALPTWKRLHAEFADHNRGLEELLGRKAPWPAGGAAASSRRAAARPGQSAPDGQAVTRRSWPRVTAVVATRNRPEMLQRAVRSVLAQAYPGEIECVVVFDQSAPADVAVEQTPARQLRIMSNLRAPGLAGARNTGILSSTSDLIAFCDDDDEWDVGKLRLQVDLLESTSAEFASSGVRFCYGDRTFVREAPSEASFSDLVRSRVASLHPSTFVIRRSALSEVGLVDEELPGSYGEDYDLLLRAAQRRPIVAVQQPLVNVYWHEQSFFAERWESIAKALGYMLDKYPVLGSDPRGLARIEGQIAFAQAASARRSAACRTVTSALRNNPLEKRAYLALAIASGVVPASSVVRLANRRGHGI
jgi:hypothetical protein